MDGNTEAVPVNLLALDGGGIRGVSELVILDEIMRRIKHDSGLKDLPRPCDYFHLIGGTSTGGLIALMLGRLAMTTDEALKAYSTIAGAIFSPENKKWKTQDGTFKATTLENHVKGVVSQKLHGSDNGDDLMLDQSQNLETGKAFVCAMPRINMAHPRRFRSYSVRENSSVDCKIWEAARATTATPTFFKSIAIGEPGHVKEEFIDAGIRCNNPAIQVMDEARLIFGEERAVGCIVSIGTGHQGPIGLSKPDSFQKILPTKLIEVLKDIATDCEATASTLSKKFENLPDLYFRFNVTHGAGGISLEEWKKMGDVVAHTKAYMEETSVSKSINVLVNLLQKPRSTPVSLAKICGVVREKPLYALAPAPHMAKLKSSPIFTGRRDLLEKLDDFFATRSGSSQPRREYLLHGMGGAGKTQLSLRFMEKNHDRFKHMFWVDASGRDTIEQGYKNIAVENIAGASDADCSAQSALRWMANLNCEWLIVFDNANDPTVLTDMIPSGNSGNILYTSRNPSMKLHLPLHAYCVVDEMKPEEAVDLLLKAARVERLTPETESLAWPVVKELSFLALAIDQAGAYIAEGLCHPNDYLQTFRNHRKDLMENPTYRGASSYDRAVYATWDISFKAIEEDACKAPADSQVSQGARSAVQILSMFAFFHNENIMEDIFKRAAESTERQRYSYEKEPMSKLNGTTVELLHHLLLIDREGKWDNFLFRLGIRHLLRFSLIRRDETSTYYSMHPLVHFWAQDRLSKLDQQRQSQVVAAVLSGSVRWTFTSEDYAFRRKLLPHIRTYQERSTMIGDLYCQNAYEMRAYALVLLENGHWTEAEELQVQVMDTHKRVLGEEHPDTLTSIVNLASTYRNQGRWAEAEKLELQVMNTYKRVLGEEHPDTLTSIANLASTYWNQGRWAEAEELNLQMMNTCKKVLGEEHPDTLTSIANLAITYQSQGRWVEAEELELQVMNTRKRLLGEEHPNTLTSIDNLASTYQNQGRWAEAEKLELQVMNTHKRVLGEEHPDTLTSIANLASTFRNQGRWTEAEKLELQVMNTHKRVLGEEHPDSLTSIANLAITYWHQGRWAEAEELELQAMNIRKRVLGEEHPDTLTSIANLASTYQSQGRWAEAEELELQVMNTRKRVLGEEHPDTLTSMNNLAFTWMGQSHNEKAMSLLSEAVRLSKAVLGPNHPDTINRDRALNEWTNRATSSNAQLSSNTG